MSDQHDAPDFPALVKTVRETQSAEAMEALWTAVYGLDAWHFVAQGEMPDVGPFVAVINEKPFVMAFTDGDLAHAFAVKHELTNADGAYPTLAVEVVSAMRSIVPYTNQGVFGILFNDGPAGFFAPLDNLVSMYERCTGNTLQI